MQFNQGGEGRPHATVADWNVRKNSLSNNLTQQVIVGRKKWLVRKISDGIEIRFLVNSH